MHESPLTEIHGITQAVHKHLSSGVEAAYLYGSAARGSRSAHDVDLLLVTDAADQAEVFAAIANIQRKNKILIHPTLVRPRELQSNPLFRQLVDSAIVLWKQV